MRQAVEYTHQTGADGTNAPLPSRKKFSLFYGPPSYVSLVLFYLHLQRVSGLSFIYMAAHAGNVNIWRMDGCTLSRSWKPLMDCLKEQKPPQGYTILALQPFSAALPLHLHQLALLTPLSLHVIQPPSAAFLSISRLPFLLYFLIPHIASFCVHKPVLFPTPILHLFHYPLPSSSPL